MRGKSKSSPRRKSTRRKTRRKSRRKNSNIKTRKRKTSKNMYKSNRKNSRKSRNKRTGKSKSKSKRNVVENNGRRVQDILRRITKKSPDIVEEDPKNKHEFVTHDNGDFPFGIDINNNVAYIYDNNDDTLLFTFNIKKFWYGRDDYLYETTDNPYFVGNSVLLELANSDNKYVYICESVIELTTPEPIIEFYGAVGNSDVVYSYATSRNYIYFFQVTRHYKDPDTSSIDYIDINTFRNVGGVGKGNVGEDYQIYYGHEPSGKALAGKFTRLHYNTLIGRGQLRK